MEKIFEQVLLYDFYGELLTEHQRKVYEDAVCNDMSLGEIAEEQGISRQGVHDLIKRCDKILQSYEAKLHLVERFAGAKGKIVEIMELTKLDDSENNRTENRIVTRTKTENVCENGGMKAAEGSSGLAQRMERIRELSEELLQEL